MRLTMRLCGVAAAALLLPACATVTRGTSQKFVIESTPGEAEVALSTGQKCVTPCKLKLKRKHGFTATFTKPGYEPLEAEVKSKFSGGGAAAGAGNVLIGGVIGAVVDGTNGSLNDLKPNPLAVTLVAVADAAQPVADPVAATTDATAEVAAEAVEVPAPAVEALPTEAPAAEAPAAHPGL
jgi:hypothetical protein